MWTPKNGCSNNGFKSLYVFQLVFVVFKWDYSKNGKKISRVRLIVTFEFQGRNSKGIKEKTFMK